MHEDTRRGFRMTCGAVMCLMLMSFLSALLVAALSVALPAWGNYLDGTAPRQLRGPTDASVSPWGK